MLAIKITMWMLHFVVFVYSLQCFQMFSDCGPDYVDCGEHGCVHLDHVCSDVITHCPGYTLGTLCKQADTGMAPTSLPLVVHNVGKM